MGKHYGVFRDQCRGRATAGVVLRGSDAPSKPSAPHDGYSGCRSGYAFFLRQCADWNKPHQPFRIYGNTYCVGTHGLSSILITSEAGHILIDGALPESAPLIVADIRSLGFHIEDVKFIVNSHAHFDHAGSIAELHRRLSGARVAASQWTADVINKGGAPRGDPQFGALAPSDLTR